jgi:hypothetical protein
MAINFTDFSRIPAQGNAAANIFEDVLKGFKMEREPAKMAEEQKQRELATGLKQLEFEHKPKEYALSDQEKGLANALKSKALKSYDEKLDLERRYKEAQIQNLLQKKIGGSPKANGEFANWIVAHPNANDDEKLAAYNEIHGRKAKHEETIINKNEDALAGRDFSNLPVNDKKEAVALMKGMGVDPVEAVSYLRKKGNSPSTYAKENKIDITEVEPDYAAGEQNIKDAQRAAAYMDEIDALDKHIISGLGQYQNKILGYSLEQIADAAEGKNTEKQAKALAARALLPELNSLRLKIAGGNIGIEALRELEDKSLGKLKVIEGLVDTPTFEKAQKLMKQWINEAGSVRIKSLKHNSMLKKKLQQGSNSSSTGTKVYNLATGQWESE